MPAHVRCLGALVGALVVVTMASVGSAAGRSRSVWDGVYSKAQVARGQKIYDDVCLRCHGETLLGSDDAKPLVGDDFLARWNGKTVFDLFDATRRKMPSDGPGVLSRREAADVVAYLLSQNPFPAGASDLASDDAPLMDIAISKSH
jgi:mono/diheme cytochrome c family protein